MRTPQGQIQEIEQTGFARFALGFTIFTLLAFGWPIASYILPLLDLTNSTDWINLITLVGLDFLLIFLLVTFLALFGKWVMKLMLVTSTIINSVALYFIVTYGVELDRTMIGNVFNTDAGETGMLLDWRIALWVVPLGIIPSLVILSAPVRMPTWVLRPLWVVGNLGAIVLVVVAAAVTWPWFDEHATRLGSRLLPYSYIVNTARYYDLKSKQNVEIVPLPDAAFSRPLPDGQRQVVILVVGESSRAMNWSWYGYGRDTNTYTKTAGFKALPPSLSCATYTTAGVACMLSAKGREAPEFSSDEALPAFVSRMGIYTQVRVNNTGLPPNMTVDQRLHANDLGDLCTSEVCNDGIGDSKLLAGLGDVINDPTHQRVFVVLHMTASHGPAYYRKYPKSFEAYSPVCETVQVRDCDQQSLINAYDNSIRYTDHLLAEVSKIAGAVPNAQALVLYAPDHGQSLGEHNVYLHGAPYAIAPAEQKTIPFIYWSNQRFDIANGLGTHTANPDIAAQDAIFHTVLGAFGLSGGPYRADRDIFAKARSGG